MCVQEVHNIFQAFISFFFFFSNKVGEPIPVILAPFDFKLKFLSLF